MHRIALGVSSLGMLHEQITEKIIGASFEVINELGFGFVESVYEKALIIQLSELGLRVERQVPLTVCFKGLVVGEFCADLLVEGKVIVELKAVKALLNEHSAQLINYLKGTGIEVGLLINFGRPKLEYKRLEHPDLYKEGSAKADPKAS
jgi:GxxExxY protein